MKKRIISLILVIATLCLTLASCGAYSLADEDFSSCATFDSAKFQEELLKLSVEDGDFTADAETREKKVWDSIYGDLAATVEKDGEKLKEGVMSGIDLVYYNYYYTADFDGVIAYFTGSMKTTSNASVQLGLKAPDDFEAQLIELLKDKDIKDYAYTMEQSGSVENGNTVFISYTCTYIPTLSDGSKGEPKESKAVSMLYEIKEGDPLSDFLIEKAASIGSTTLLEFNDEANDKTYTGIKIDWRIKENRPCIGTAKDTPHTEKTEVTDTAGVVRNLANKELTYYVYPVSYVKVPEWNAENFINEVVGDTITLDIITRVLFGEKFSEKTEDEKNAILDLYKTGDAKDVTLASLIESIATLQKDLATALTNKEKAETTETSKKDAYDTANSAYEADKTDDKLNARDSAKQAYDDAKTAADSARAAYDAKLVERNAKVSALINVAKENEFAGDATADARYDILSGYEKLTFEYLRKSYNEEVRMNVAKAVNKLLEDCVTVDSSKLPQKAVDITVERLMENYEADFYEKPTSSTEKSNYSKYSGVFNDYFIATVKAEAEDSTITTYDKAYAAVVEMAKEYIVPVVRIYVVSKAYDLISEEAYEDYKKTNEKYNSNVLSYGENSVRYAYQFDRLMNHFVEYDEVDGAYQYKNVTVVLKPAE